MPSLEEVLNIEPAIEEGIKTLVDAAGFNGVTRLNANELESDVERVEIRLKLGAATGHYFNDFAGNLRPDAWQAQLSLQLVTSAANSTDHPAARGKLRALVSNLERTLTLPMHAITDVPLDSDTTPTLKTQEGIEYSTLNYLLFVNVRPEAWPTE